MSLIADSDQAKLGQRFTDTLTGDVRLRLTIHARECSLCAQARQLLKEITALSDRLTLSTEKGQSPLPEIRLEGGARGEVRFVGLPSGYEFPMFIDSIIEVSRGQTSLSPQTLARMAALRHRVHIQVFTTPT